jgi:hypothetical protein
MTIICLIICNTEGKLFFARQFIPLFSKKDFFTQCSIFIKNYSSNKQLKYLDIYLYRYLYQLLNDNYILLLITKLNNSNIIIEEEALKVCHRLIQQRIGININPELIKKEGLNLAIDLEEVIQNGLIQNLHIGEINTKINMIQVDKEEIKKKFEEKLNKQKNVMIKQYKEMEKLEELNKKQNNEININFDIDENKLNLNKNSEIKNKENHNNMIHEKIKLNYKFEMVKINKPIVFKTPSGKVVLLAEQKKPVESRKDKLINGIKLGGH